MTVELPKSDLRAQIVAAGVFLAFAVGIVVFARSFRGAADEALASEFEQTPPPTPARLAVLTPQTAMNAAELRAALEKVFGKNARGVSSITFVDYDQHPDRLHITFALDARDLSAPGGRPAAHKRIREIVEAVYPGQMPWTWVMLTGTTAARDREGGVSESTVIRVQFLRDRLRRLDWKKVTAEEVRAAAEQHWAHLDLKQ